MSTTHSDKAQDLCFDTAYVSYIYRVGQKCGTLLLDISSPITDRFSKFFHWHMHQTICNNEIITYPTTL